MAPIRYILTGLSVQIHTGGFCLRVCCLHRLQNRTFTVVLLPRNVLTSTYFNNRFLFIGSTEDWRVEVSQLKTALNDINHPEVSKDVFWFTWALRL